VEVPLRAEMKGRKGRAGRYFSKGTFLLFLSFLPSVPHLHRTPFSLSKSQKVGV
jgi:hypothetical protein